MSVVQESLSTAIDELTNIFADRITTNVSVRDTTVGMSHGIILINRTR